MPIRVVAEHTFNVGEATVVEGKAPEGDNLAVFEDDGETGYFYACDPSATGQPIQDALHIYNVSDVVDREIPSVVKIGWSLDSAKVVLLVNDYPHAVFDLEAKQGYCRSGFPPPAGEWSLEGHE